MVCDEADPFLGSLVGQRYRVAHLHDDGVDGPVYAGRDVHTGQAVTVQVVQSRHHAWDDAARAQVERDVAVRARLHHPGLGRTLGAFPFPEGGLAIVQELLEGEDLSSVLLRCRRLSRERCLPWFVDACAALQHMHERGLLHRHLNPSNIVLDPAGRPRLRIHIDVPTALHQRGTAFISREYLLGSALDARTDVYSLGATLYVCLAGRAPFQAKEQGLLLMKIARELPAPLRSHDPSIPEDLAAVVHRAMAVEPDGRYDSARELGEALRALLPGA